METCFNPLDRGNSNQMNKDAEILISAFKCFNPLDRGNSNQILSPKNLTIKTKLIRFNPLDRGNSNQITQKPH